MTQTEKNNLRLPQIWDEETKSWRIVGEPKWIEPADPLAKNFPENDPLFKECGSKIDSDILYQKIERKGINDLSFLEEYLTDDEIKDRVSYHNYVGSKVDDVINIYLKHVEVSKIKREIAQKERELVQLKMKLKHPNLFKDSPVQELSIDDLIPE